MKAPMHLDGRKLATVPQCAQARLSAHATTSRMRSPSTTTGAIRVYSYSQALGFPPPYPSTYDTPIALAHS
jgi:hypothetical protein